MIFFAASAVSVVRSGGISASSADPQPSSMAIVSWASKRPTRLLRRHGLCVGCKVSEYPERDCDIGSRTKQELLYYQIAFMILNTGGQKGRLAAYRAMNLSDMTALHSLTVVIPTLNAAGTLPATLASLRGGA